MDCLRKVAKGVRFDVRRYENDANLFLGKRRNEQLCSSETVCNIQNATDESKISFSSEKDMTQLLRNEKRIKVKGEDVPKPLETFSALQQLTKNVNVASILANVTRLGFEKPTPIQMQAIPLMLNHRELICCAPTGSGKTLAFLLPLIIQLNGPRKCGFRAVILAPTRELAKQIHRECIVLSEGTGLRSHLIKNVYAAKKKFGLQSKLKFDILVTTPKRLVFLLQQKSTTININNVEWLVVDECDKLFESSFRQQLAVIFNACANSKAQVCRAFFSATFDKDLQSWFEMHLENVVTVIVGGKNKTAESVDQRLLFVGTEEGKRIALSNLIASGLETPVLIFVKSIDKAKKLQKELSDNEIRVDVIHSKKSCMERDSIVRKFRQGKIWFLICTELLSRGIDFKGVNIIINYDFPKSYVDYIHRIGRTGRAGRQGKAITFFTENDVNQCRHIKKVIRVTGCDLPDDVINKLSSRHLRNF